MLCPTHKEPLLKTKNGFSFYCPRCDYKTRNPNKFWLPDMRHTVEVPTTIAFSDFTLSDISVNGDNELELSDGKITGCATSPQLINLTRKDTRYWDCTKVKLNWTHNSLKIGDIKYSASNDGVGYRTIKTADVNFELNKGNELRQYKQAKYNDLRIKISLSRNESGDTSPTVSKVLITYNKVKL